MRGKFTFLDWRSGRRLMLVGSRCSRRDTVVLDYKAAC